MVHLEVDQSEPKLIPIHERFMFSEYFQLKKIRIQKNFRICFPDAINSLQN